MKRPMLRVAAFLGKRLGRLLRHANLHQHLLVAMLQLAKVSAQTTLTFMNLLHDCSLRQINIRREFGAIGAPRT